MLIGLTVKYAKANNKNGKRLKKKGSQRENSSHDSKHFKMEMTYYYKVESILFPNNHTEKPKRLNSTTARYQTLICNACSKAFY